MNILLLFYSESRIHVTNIFLRIRIDGYQKDRIVAEDTEPQKAIAVDLFLARVTSMGLLFKMSI